MEFGRLASVAGVDFALPPEPAPNARVRAAGRGAAAGAPRVRIGTAGWSDKGFVGRLYAPGTRRERFLAEYARAFPTNELNSTSYGVSRARIARWSAAVPSGFRFCPKLPLEVTHERGLDAERAAPAMERFLEALAGFGPKLGRAWGVVPPALGPDRLPVLDAFLTAFAARAPLALELRHPGWFADGGALDAAASLFGERGVVLVLTDVAGRRDVAHMRLSVPEAFVRFVGNAPDASDGARLDAWAERLASWLDAGLERAWFFLHQKHDPDAVALAERLPARLAAGTGVDPLPELAARLSAARERQGELF